MLTETCLDSEFKGGGGQYLLMRHLPERQVRALGDGSPSEKSS